MNYTQRCSNILYSLLTSFSMTSCDILKWSLRWSFDKGVIYPNSPKRIWKLIFMDIKMGCLTQSYLTIPIPALNSFYGSFNNMIKCRKISRAIDHGYQMVVCTCNDKGFGKVKIIHLQKDHPRIWGRKEGVLMYFFARWRCISFSTSDSHEIFSSCL